MRPFYDKHDKQPHDYYPEMKNAYYVSSKVRHTHHPKWHGHDGKNLTLDEAKEFSTILHEDWPGEWIDVGMDLRKLRECEEKYGILWIPPIEHLLPHERRRYHGTTKIPSTYRSGFEIREEIAQRKRHSAFVSVLPLLPIAFGYVAHAASGASICSIGGLIAGLALFGILSLDGERHREIERLERQEPRFDSW